MRNEKEVIEELIEYCNRRIAENGGDGDHYARTCRLLKAQRDILENA